MAVCIKFVHICYYFFRGLLLLLFSSIGILGLYRIETLGSRLSVKSIESKPWINGGCFISKGEVLCITL